MAHVLLAMSGGLDSSMAAYRLRKQGHNVTGLFMQQGINNAYQGLPCLRDAGSTAAEVDARRVADHLGIPLIVADHRAAFRPIIDYFVDEYLAGRTPNPCVRCNQTLKFGTLFDEADRLGAEYLATGHYARVVPSQVWRDALPAPWKPADNALVEQGDTPALLRGLDASKDQSYALFGIAPSRLRRILFPIGDSRKSEIRRLAHQLKLGVAEKDESQDVCFIPDGNHAAFIRAVRPQREDTSGEIVTTDGEVVGRHDGYERFTIGQRKGLNVAMGERFFVVRIEPDTRRVVIGRKQTLARRSFRAVDANWLIKPPLESFHCEVKIRYRSRPTLARIVPGEMATFDVILEEPSYGVAPGQAAVCYFMDRVLGGGTIA